jgi:DNA-binding NtrC family response regulator
MSNVKPAILIVDDEVDICRNVQDILADLGYEADIAFDGFSALEKIRARPYDVALLDLKMPGMDGLTLYREIKRLRADTVAIIVSAYASSSTAEEALAAGAWKVLAKPVDLPKLMGLVGQALSQPLVLVVDDDPDLCASLWDLFRDRGFRVGVAHDSKQAKEQLRQRDFGVVLIDMKLPEGDGHGVYHLVRESNPEARTIVITGHRSEMDELVGKVVSEGADGVCYKPFDVPKLLDMVGRMAEAKKSS